MNSKSSLLLSSLETNTATAITGVTIRQITSIKQQLSTSSFISYPTHSNISPLIKVKKELPKNEIKEYAANAMSELLGWYGYDKVDSKCTHGLNLDHFESLTSSKHNCNHRQKSYLQSHIIRSNCVNNPNLSDGHTQASASRVARSPQLRSLHSPSTSSISVISNTEIDVTQASPSVLSTTAPASPRVLENSDSASDSPDSPTICSWCGCASGGTWEPGNAAFPCSNINNSGRFCSEACFAAGRRAAFKRARTCNWCRHIRRSVSYVDFQGGESQLQFCSDKCLNQYKMNIFCRETQAHLALQGIAGLSSNNLNTSGGLITPELWLRDCQSPTIPPPNSTEDEALVVDNEPIIWPEASIKNRNQIQRISKKNEKQLFDDTAKTISITPQQFYNFECTSNDTFAEETEEAIKESLKDEEERKIKKYREMNSLISFDASVELDSPVAYKQLQNPRECSKESSTDHSREGTIYLKDVRKLLEKGVEKMCHETTSYRSQKISISPTQHSEHQTIYQNKIPPRNITIERPHLLQPMPIKFTSKSENILKSSSMTMKPPQLHYLHDRFSTNSKSGFLPPVTVLVPYPIPIPIPLPIPIPIPLFGNLFDSKNYNLRETKDDDISNASATDINFEIPIVPEDLSQRGKTNNLQNKSIPKQVQSLNVIDKATILLDSSNSSSPAIPSVVSSCGPYSTMTIPDILPILPIIPTTMNSKPTRKRRQSVASDQVDMKIKPRSKFVPP